MRLEIYDLETTGVDTRTCEPVQIASMLIDLRNDGTFDVLNEFSCYLQIKADSIPAGAQAVHGIGIETVREHGLDPYEVIRNLEPMVMSYNGNAYDDKIVHRYGARFELSFDLYVVAKRLKSMGLIESAKLGRVYHDLTGKEPENAHDALGDVRMTAALIQPMMRALNVSTFSQMIDNTDLAVGNTKMVMPFGKYKGERIGDLPRSYARWALENLTDIDKDLRASLEMVA